MTTPVKMGWYVPLVLYAITHLVIIGVTYGSLTSETKNLTKAANGVVLELRAIKQHIYKLRENDIMLKSQQDYNTKRIEKLEANRP